MMQTGTYILVLRLAAETDITIGRLGRLAFPPGYYYYVGSAFGPGGLTARLRHHQHLAPRPHWHIDYLRQAAPLDRIWHAEHASPREHAWAATLAEITTAGIPRFGASDCRCRTHLFHTRRRLPARLLHATIPGINLSRPAGGSCPV